MLKRIRIGEHWSRAVRGNVLVLSIVSLLNDVASEMIYPLLPLFFTGLVSAASAPIYIGLMDGIAESISSLLKIVSGRASDRIGRRKPFAVWGYALSSLSRPLIALSAAAWEAIVLRSLDRIGKGLRTSPRDALISDSTEPAIRAFAFSFHRATDHAGAIIGPLLAVGLLYPALGHSLWTQPTSPIRAEAMEALRWLFAATVLPGMLTTWLTAAKVREVICADFPAPSRPARIDPALPGRFYGVLAAIALFSLGNSSDLFLVFYGQTRFQLGIGWLLTSWIVLHLGKILFSPVGGYLADKLSRKWVIIAGWSLYASSYFALTQITQSMQFLLLIFIYGFYYGLAEGAERALIADLVPAAARGRAYGLYHGIVGFAALPASLIFGVFWVELGHRVAFLTGAGLAGAAALVLIVSLMRFQQAV